jgi:hypothetical protein
MSIVLLGSSSGSVTLQEPTVAGSTVIDLPATSGTMAVLPTSTSVLPEASGGTGTSIGYNGFKNRIINGAMVIDQRNAGASVTPASGAFVYNVDRWGTYQTQASKITVQQNAGSVTPPTGFSNYVGITSSSAYSVISSDQFLFEQAIEASNISDLSYGTANAQTVTVSFWVRSSLTGTFAGCLRNYAGSRSYPFTYTISAANTWEQKTITVTGDTTGTWVTSGSGGSMYVIFNLGSGSTYLGTAGAWTAGNYTAVSGAVNVVGTSGATFYITGVQLEKGSTATSFDYRPYGTELALCQRYFWKVGGTAAYEPIAMGLVDATTQVSCITSFPVAMRAAPSVGYSSASAFYVNDAASQPSTTAVAIYQPGLQTTGITVTSSGLNLGRAARFFIGNSTSAYINFSAEL